MMDAAKSFPAEDAPKYLAIKQRLIDEIRGGRLHDGQSLPGEKALSLHYSASRSTIRNALRELRAAGLLETSKGRRSVVRDLSARRRNRRFLWFGRRPEHHDEPARAPIYDALLRLAEADRTTLTYWMMRGENDDRWLAEHLHEYDGIVVADIGATELMPELARKLRGFGNSVCTQERGDNLARCVCHTDDYRLGRMAAEFLFGQGFARIAMLCVSSGLRTLSMAQACNHRFNGFMDACLVLGRGRQYFPTVFSSAETDVTDPAPLLESLKLRENRIQVLWVMSDAYALKCIETLSKMGFRIPEDISVLGCDGIDSGAAAPVPLTTIGHPHQGIAERIYRLLLDGIGREIPSEVISIPPELIIRKSVKIASSNPIER